MLSLIPVAAQDVNHLSESLVVNKARQFICSITSCRKAAYNRQQAYD